MINPALEKISANFKMDNGVSSLGFKTIVLPIIYIN
jgi:hypothetical protein